MTRVLISIGGLMVALFAASGPSPGQDRSKAHDGWTPDAVYGKGGTDRNSPPFVVRRYKKDSDNPDKVAKKQPPGFVKTIPDGYELGKDETFRVHKGVDLPSRPDPTKPSAPMEFKAGIHGKVLKAGGGDYNTITVQLGDGSIVQYLHASKVIVAVDQVIGPDTPLGLTGNTGAADIHLHIQARDKDDKIIHPDAAFRAGRQKPVTLIEIPRLKFVDFDVELSSERVPNVKVEGGRVRFGYDEHATKKFNPVGTWKKVNANASQTVTFAADNTGVWTMKLVTDDDDRSMTFKWSLIENLVLIERTGGETWLTKAGMRINKDGSLDDFTRVKK